MFNKVEDVAKLDDKALYEHVSENHIIVGTDQDYQKYRDAVKVVREYETTQMAVAEEVFRRLKDYEDEESDVSSDDVYDMLRDFMSDNAGGSFVWNYEYQEYWVPSNC